MKETDVVFESLTIGRYLKKMKTWLNSHKTFVALLSTIFIFVIIKSLIFGAIVILFEDFNHEIGATNPTIQTGDILIDLLGTRWDSWFYLVIADNGEYLDHLRPTNTHVWNFAPLFPFLIRLFMDIGNSLNIEIPVTTAGVIVANLFSVTSLVSFFFLARLYFDEYKSMLASLLFAFFPTTFLFSSVAYAEGVFITFAILSWYFFEKQKYPLSGLMLGLGALARFPGSIIFFLYIPIYLVRRMKDKSVKDSIGSLLAIPLFPFLVLIRVGNTIGEFLKYNSFTKSLVEQFNERNPTLRSKNQTLQKSLDFLDTGLGWILIFGLLPLSWMIFVKNTTGMTLSDIAVANWNTRYIAPFAGFFDLLSGGNVKWTLEIYSYAFLILGLGLIALSKKKGFSLVILGQVALYTGYQGITSWGIARYMGTVFHGPLVLAEEIKSIKFYILFYTIFLIYAFIGLWGFVTWSYWII
ncbi:MAG: glycosyltransferase family 39 protein [Candidatus Hodarchaeales archaeon]